MSNNVNRIGIIYIYNMSNNKFGVRLRELREERKVSQTQLANHLGYSQNTISRWETSDREPSLDDVIAVARFFNVTTDYLLGLTELL